MVQERFQLKQLYWDATSRRESTAILYVNNGRQVDETMVSKLREEARAAEKHDVELDIAGYDIDGRMINISKVNAKAAGVLHDIHFKQLAVKDFKD